jgi:HlyD family secretion protein
MGQFGQGGHVAGAVRTEPAVVFTVGEDGAIEPRMVMIGLTDWDRTQVVSGLDEGDYVALIGVARLQAEREEFMERMRSNMGGGNPFGMGGMPGMRGGMRGPH